MKVETRRRVFETESSYYALVLIADDEMEQAKLDMVFGSRVGDDGVLGTGRAVCKLSTDCRDHYIHIEPDRGDQE